MADELLVLEPPRAARLRLAIAALGLLALISWVLVALVAGWLIYGLMPAQVTTFEGMNLQLPLPTRILMALARASRSPVGLMITILGAGAFALVVAGAGGYSLARLPKDPVTALQIVLVQWIFLLLATLALGAMALGILLPFLQIL